MSNDICMTCGADWVVDDSQCQGCRALTVEMIRWMFKRDVREMALCEAALRARRYERAKMERRVDS